MLSIHNSYSTYILPSNNSIHLHQFVYPNYHMLIQIVTSRHAVDARIPRVSSVSSDANTVYSISSMSLRLSTCIQSTCFSIILDPVPIAGSTKTGALEWVVMISPSNITVSTENGL